MSLSASRQETRAEENGCSPLPGEGRGFVCAEWKSLFSENGLSRIEDFFAVTGKALSKPGLGTRYRARLELKNGNDARTVFYKRYRGEKLRSLLQRWTEDGERLPIAGREVRVARALDRIGITTFQPLAWGWQGGWGTQQKSFIVMSELAGTSLERWLEEKSLQQTSLDWTQKKNLVSEVAALARRLHGAGWFHRDFYLCHIFVEERGEDFKLSLLDLARVFRPRWRVDRWRIKDLAQLDYSTPRTTFSRAMRIRFAKIYLGCDKLSAAQKTLLRKVAQRSKSIAQRDMRKGK